MLRANGIGAFVAASVRSNCGQWKSFCRGGRGGCFLTTGKTCFYLRLESMNSELARWGNVDVIMCYVTAYS
jgi:hypothetical protein